MEIVLVESKKHDIGLDKDWVKQALVARLNYEIFTLIRWLTPGGSVEEIDSGSAWLDEKEPIIMLGLA